MQKKYYEIAIASKPLKFTYYSYKDLKEGDLVEIKIKSKIYKGYILKKTTKPDFECKEIENITDFYLPNDYIEIAKFISTYYFCSIGEALGLFVPFKKIKKIKENSFNLQPSTFNLSIKQEEALNFLKLHQTSLLFGDTGSGKTEIYIEYFKEIINSGKSAIFLMPEISLTPQMEERLKKHFKNSVAIWHSKISKNKKEKILEDIYSGKIKLIAGPRSALFLPMENLGLIIVDEEHDDSYKAHNRPRYNAKDLAVYFGKKLNINVVLGSATPSLSSYKNYPRFRLKGSFYKGKKDFIWDNSTFTLSPIVLENIEKTLKAKKQAIIFLPTRGNFKYLICQDCGESVKCPFCDVGMSLHFDKNALVCHYCNFAQRIPKECPKCHSPNLQTCRIGTTEIKEELEKIFPEAKIEKFDKDVITTQKKLEKILKEFSQKKIDILVGTQMLSKGHDYPDVSLSVILGIDYILNMADFRARERAVNLFIQIAGRSGRKEEGKVIIQTKNRDFFEKYLDFEDFIKDELKFREDFYPPFKRLALINFSHKNREFAKENMQNMLNSLKKFKDIEIVGFGEAPIEKIANRFRFNILLRSSSAKALIVAINVSKTSLAEVDMDPVNII
ncbi:primosomal protein N' [Nitrosophilus kaiyonis]|uniref:primosomal protein N' n=1 Tax=Nitrosophilus kaiyonis TaxID=2930200 RepID=UPI002493A0FD|nr:primosomal protein N' [Nitrosophilus kaiyonis]